MKQIIFTLMMLVLPAGIMAQVDDLYYVPTKKKVKKEVKVTTNDAVKVAPATNTTQSGTNVVRIAPKSNIVNGIDEDAYNRRSTTSTYSTEQEYTDEQTYEYQEEYVEEPTSDADYTYSSRIVRFHSPRRAVVLSSPLYWDVVYNCGLDNWTIYDDGIYWDVYPDYSYSSIYVSPWYSPSWSWYTGCGWGFSFGWGYSSWYWNWGYHHPHWHYPHYPLGGIHHHHGHHIAGGGWRHSFSGGYRNATYSNRNGGGREGYVPRATGPSRANAGVRSGTVARNNRNETAQSNRTARGTNNSQRVYDRPSSTRNNVTRNGVTNERTRNNNVERTTGNTRANNAVRQENNNRTIERTNNNTNTRANNAVRQENNSKAKRNTTQQKELRTNNSNRNNRSSVSQSNNSRSNNSRSTIGSQSRGSNFSGGGSRNSGGGGSRGGGGGSRGGRR